MLQSHYFSWAGNGNILQQDGAPCHRSRSTMGYLQSSKGVESLDWPAQSPDLNIIENLWSTLQKRIAGRKIGSQEELWEAIQEEWEAIPREDIIKLFQGMKRRINAVIRSRGHSIKY